MNINSILLSEVRAKQRVLMVGPPGSGKTSRFRAIADELGMDFIAIPLHHTERVDWSGAFVPDSELGITRQLPLETLHLLRTTTKDTLLLVDDLCKAPVDVQGALKSVITRGGLGSKLSPHVVVCGATNRPGDKAGVSAIDESLRTEFDAAYNIATPGVKSEGVILGEWQDEVDGWCEWAASQDFDPAIVAFHQSTAGAYLYQWKPSADPSVRWADYRSWGAFGERVKKGLVDNVHASACLGRETACVYLSFSKLRDQLPDVADIMKSPTTAKVPDDSGALWMISAVLAQHCNPTTASKVAKYATRLDRKFAVFCVRLACRKSDQDLASKTRLALHSTPEWRGWFDENKELFQ